MGTLLVLTGPPGAGKSTVTRLLAEDAGPGALVDGDAFFHCLGPGAIEPSRPESHEQNSVVTTAAAAAAGAFTTGGLATIYDGVVGPWFCPRSGAHPASTDSTTPCSCHRSRRVSSGC